MHNTILQEESIMNTRNTNSGFIKTVIYLVHAFFFLLILSYAKIMFDIYDFSMQKLCFLIAIIVINVCYIFFCYIFYIDYRDEEDDSIRIIEFMKKSYILFCSTLFMFACFLCFFYINQKYWNINYYTVTTFFFSIFPLLTSVSLCFISTCFYYF